MDTWTLIFGLMFVILAPFILAGIANTYYGIRYNIPFARSGKSAINTMMELGNVREGVTVLDIGSGTGDIVIEAARRGARAQGIEINPFLVWITRWRIARAGLSHNAHVIRGDMFKMEIPSADIVTLYLPSKRTIQLREKLEKYLPRHALVLSRGFIMPDWSITQKIRDIAMYRMSSILSERSERA